MMREDNLLDPIRKAAVWLPGVALLGGCWLVYSAWRLPFVEATPLARAATPPAVSVSDGAPDWSVFHTEQAPTAVATEGLAGRFRLAGTFFAFGEEGETRRAILDDLRKGGQHIVGEGESIDDVAVVRIYDARVVLRVGSEEAEIWLGFSRAAQVAGQDGASEDDADADADGAAAFGGRKVGEHAFVFERGTLEAYYQTVLDDPERLVGIFDSMRPVRNESGRIDGYRLNIQAEGDFYRAVGFEEGDVVREVNGMRMSSRRRAEHWLGEFARNRANAFTIALERNGQPVTLTYQIR